jgi:hypothetical protein
MSCRPGFPAHLTTSIDPAGLAAKEPPGTRQLRQRDAAEFSESRAPAPARQPVALDLDRVAGWQVRPGDAAVSITFPASGRLAAHVTAVVTFLVR